MTAISMLSGGMDSTVALAEAIQDHGPTNVYIFHASYGQRTQKREFKAMLDIIDYYNIDPGKVFNPIIPFMRLIGGSSITDMSLDIRKTGIDKAEIPNTYVPFRNGLMLSIATSWAEVIGASDIYIGAVNEDSSGYPDCRPEFIDAFQGAIKEGTKPGSGITIKAPLIALHKNEIIQKGMALDAPLHLTWSCYENEIQACGLCDSCRLRLKAFKEAGIADLIRYEAYPDGYK